MLLDAASAAYGAGDPRGEELVMDAAVMISEIPYDSVRGQLIPNLAKVVAEGGDDALVERVAASARPADTEQVRALLAIELAGQQKFPSALKMADTITDGAARAVGSQRICASLCSAGRTSEALNLAKTIEETGSRTEALGEVAASLSDNSAAEAETLFAEVFSAVESLSDPGQREYVAHSLSAVYARKGCIDEAIKMAGIMSDEGFRPLTVSMIAAAMPANHNQRSSILDQAFELSMGVEPSANAPWLISNAATAIAQAGDRRALEVLRQALDIKRSLYGTDPMQGAKEHGNLLKSLMWTFFNGGFLENAIEAAQQVPYVPSEALAELSRELLAGGDFEIADRVAGLISNSEVRQEAWASRSTALMRAGRKIDALITAGQLELSDYLRQIAKWTAKEEMKVPITALEDALEVAGWKHPYWRKLHNVVVQPPPELPA